MHQLYDEFLNRIDADALMRRTVELGAIELAQTTACHHRAAEYVLGELEKAGIPGAELIEFPADGRSVYLDKKMPLAWDASVGRLTDLNPVPVGSWKPVNVKLSTNCDNVLADYQRHPFHLVKGSVSTPPGGIITRVITEPQFLAGEDPRGAMVMLEPATRPNASVLRALLDLGALGFISDCTTGRYNAPDSLQWLNAATETPDWHVTLEDRPFIGFSVSPRTGDLIRSRAGSADGLKVKVECDGRRYAGTEPAVTALIPGKSGRELWIMAHLYEPLLNDDAAGVSAAIEIARLFMQRETPLHSIRLVFAMELYGYAAYAAMRGEKNLRNEVIGGCNIDTLGSVAGETMCLHGTGSAKPFIGNDLLRTAYETFKDTLKLEYIRGSYMDDMFLGDPTVGVPTVWLLGESRGFWHNSVQCDPGFIDRDTLSRSTAFAAAYLHAVANHGDVPPAPTPALKERRSPWRDYAARMVFARRKAGFPYSLADVPPHERIALPDRMLYGPFANVLCALDGKKDLARAILEAEAETGTMKGEEEVKKYINAVNFLADHGYLEAVERPEIDETQIADALGRLGVSPGAPLLVHASVSNCGYIRGGAQTIIRAVANAAGTALFPTFTRPYIYLGGVNRNWKYRPFDPSELDSIWTGNIGKVLLREFPDALRSRHITHSWGGLGPLANECLDGHAPADPPAGKDSPLFKALQLGGRILYFGAGLKSTTFLHCLEDLCDMPFLETVFCRVREADGSLKTVKVERHLPGHRDFYRPDAENSKFFRRAVEAGLEIRRTPLGMGTLQLIELKPLYEIGVKLLQEDRRILLCDSDECLFCRKFK